MTAPGTYARAFAGYDPDHERALVDAIGRAIAEASILRGCGCDCDVTLIRSGETTSALLTVLATILAMTPSVTRSPTAQRRMIEELRKRLRKRVAAAERDRDVQDFALRAGRTEGTA